MQIRDIGFNGVHGRDFVFRSESIKSDGFDEHLILFLRTQALCCIDGQEIYCPAASVLVLTPEADYMYRAVGESYVNDWIFIFLSKKDQEFLSKLKVKFNEPFSVSNMEELSGIVHALAYEHFSSGDYHEEIEQGYLKLLFYKMARGIVEPGGKGETIDPKLLKRSNAALTMLHADILRNPGKNRSLDEMADTIGISRSGLQHQYKKMLGIIIKEDMILSRTERAKRMLAETNNTIREIAFACGYGNEYHFIRQFKKITGKTPTEYRSFHINQF